MWREFLMLGREVIPGPCEAGALQMLPCGDTRDGLHSSHGAGFPGRTLNVSVSALPGTPLPGPALPGLSFSPSSEHPTFCNQMLALSHKFAPNPDPEILTVPELLWVSLHQMSSSFWLLETSGNFTWHLQCTGISL